MNHEDVAAALSMGERAAQALEVLALLQASHNDDDDERRERMLGLAVQKADVIAGRG